MLKNLFYSIKTVEFVIKIKKININNMSCASLQIKYIYFLIMAAILNRWYYSLSEVKSKGCLIKKKQAFLPKLDLFDQIVQEDKM